MKFLVVTAAFGTGHNQVAEALVDAAVAEGHTAEVCDPLAASLPTVNALATKGFIQLLTAAPGLYRYAYNQAETPGRWQHLKYSSLGLMGRLMWPKVAEMLAQARPDAVLCTHPFPLGALATLRRQLRLQVPLAGVLTDFAPHSFWIHSGVDQYYVASGEMAGAMGVQGVTADRVTVTGIPIRRAFAERIDRCEAARLLGLDPQRPIVLIMGGGLGLGPIRELVAEISRMPMPLQVLVAAGHNRKLYEQLQPFATQSAGVGPSVHVYEYVPYVHVLMAASDLLVSKAGAVTASEALAVGLPMLLADPVPGHEERNQELLVAAGAARTLRSPAEFAPVLQQLLSNPHETVLMQKAARRLGQPDAASRLIHHLAGIVQPEAVILPGRLQQEQVCTA